ncbi:GrpB family protein [Devosia soli]|uniref:GrpB family protein n=1 Tax=Devosia soli TaxID=361041 RepID=UPI00069C1EA8|nr:GrpB family protein [Devosia soli]
MLGLKHGVNYLVDYQTCWKLEFEAESRRIKAALGKLAKGVEHYGSTAVEGMRAKPILDILVGVEPLELWKECFGPLESLGYDYAEHAGVPGHFVFGKGRDKSERTHLLHIVQFEGPSWSSNLQLRDALRQDEHLRERYVAAKEAAIASAPTGRVQYNELKRAFIDEAKALLRDQSWRRRQAPQDLITGGGFRDTHDRSTYGRKVVDHGPTPSGWGTDRQLLALRRR